MKRFMVLFVVLSVLFTFDVGAAQISEDVRELMSISNEKIPVIVEMKDVMSLSGNDLDIATLKQNADITQKDILDFISANKNISGIKTLWAFSALSLKADADMIEKLSTREDVERIFLNKEFKLFKDNTYRNSILRTTDGDGLVYGLKSMNVDKVWDDFGIDGTGVISGVVDSGINKELSVFDGKLLAGRNFAGEENDFSDKNGHGTHVSGTVVGSWASDDLYELKWGMFWSKVGTFEGNIGVAPGAKFYFAKCMQEDGKISFDDIIESIQWLSDPDGDPGTDDGARVINASLGSDTSVPELREPLVNIQNTGVFLCFAAGNSGKVCGSPADFPEIFAVGAVDSNDNRASFSSIGPVNWDGIEYIKPDVCAPGVKVISYYGDKLSKLDGTSMASPNTTGVITLMYQADPTLTVDEIKQILKETALDLGDKGADNKYGYGRVDAYAAISKITGRNKLKSLVYRYQKLNDEIVKSSSVLDGTLEAEKAYMYRVSKKDEMLERIIELYDGSADSDRQLRELVEEGLDLSEIFENIR